MTNPLTPTFSRAPLAPVNTNKTPTPSILAAQNRVQANSGKVNSLAPEIISNNNNHNSNNSSKTNTALNSKLNHEDGSQADYEFLSTISNAAEEIFRHLSKGSSAWLEIKANCPDENCPDQNFNNKHFSESAFLASKTPEGSLVVASIKNNHFASGSYGAVHDAQILIDRTINAIAINTFKSNYVAKFAYSKNRNAKAISDLRNESELLDLIWKSDKNIEGIQRPPHHVINISGKENVEPKTGYIISKYDMNGFSFHQYCERDKNKFIDASLMMELSRQLFQGLKKLKELKIAHLDIKPSNMLFESNENSPHLVISDLGGARVINPSTVTFDVSKKIYVIPEQTYSMGYFFIGDLGALELISSVFRDRRVAISDGLPEKGDKGKSVDDIDKEFCDSILKITSAWDLRSVAISILEIIKGCPLDTQDKRYKVLTEIVDDYPENFLNLLRLCLEQDHIKRPSEEDFLKILEKTA